MNGVVPVGYTLRAITWHRHRVQRATLLVDIGLGAAALLALVFGDALGVVYGSDTRGLLILAIGLVLPTPRGLIEAMRPATARAAVFAGALLLMSASGCARGANPRPPADPPRARSSVAGAARGGLPIGGDVVSPIGARHDRGGARR